MNVCLVIIFNHRFDENIAILKKYYKNNFDTIKFLVPFYDGDDEDVIPVYECSYQFQGYLIQAYEKLNIIHADYYFFVADDIIINPNLNQNNVIEKINMLEKDAFITEMIPVNSHHRFDWIHSRYSSKPFMHKSTSWKGNIPDKEVALKIFNVFLGHDYPETYIEDFWGNQSKEEIERFVKENGGDISIPYPMMSGYSDFFILSGKVLYKIARTCGVFSAMNLFVEIALPTAIVLNVAREHVVVADEIDYKAQIFWNNEIRVFENKYDFSLRKLIDEWDESVLFVHPVKLSKWDISGIYS